MQNPMMTFKKWQYISIFYEVMHFLFGDFIFPSYVDGDFFLIRFLLCHVLYFGFKQI